MKLKKYFTNKYYVVLIAVFCSVLWGSAFPVLKISYLELGISPSDVYAKIVFAGMRFLIASFLIFIVLISMKQDLKVKIKVLLKLLVLGILQTSLQYFFFYNGLAYTSGIKGAILASSGTFFVVILAHFIYTDDRINWKKTIGLILGLTGILLVNWGKGGVSSDFSFRGEGFLIIAGFINSLATIFAKKLSKNLNPILINGWQMFLGASLLIVVGLTGMDSNTMTFSSKAWVLLFYAAFLSATAFSLWYMLLKYNKAGEITLFKFMIPVSGAFLSVIFIPSERFTIYMFNALLLVAVGITAVNYRRRT